MSFVLLALGLAGIGSWAAWAYSETQQIRRALRKAPTKRIQELRDNELGKVVGHVRSMGKLLDAPLSGRPCVYFVAIVEERESGRSSTSWRTVIKETHGVRFMLEDGSGRAVVDTTAARVAIVFDGKSQSGTFDDPTPAEQAFLSRYEEKGQRWIFNRNLRYREAVIAEGEVIAVLGAGTREPDPDAPPAEAYRGDMQTRLRLTSSRKYPLVISDVPSVVI